MKKKAKFITFEGVEGSGKSSIISLVRNYLVRRGLKVVIFRDPGSTPVGEKIRAILLDKKNSISHYTELLLYLAARAQLIEEKLKRALNNYDIVICDRFFDSTLVYQGYGLGLGKIVEESVDTFSFGIVPDITIILDSDVRKSLNRLRKKDRIEMRSLKFHYRLRKGYRKLAKKFPKRVRLINADKSLNEVFDEVKHTLEDFLLVD
ncbi:MAG: dTMP kinase [Candidatus Omnitrophica bacterium]|nr:dTMP kinase [Candidatus Omnitrophota bacterium]MCM8826046.1 dTMP kinase [Candidatus Omnitrophota bacterium]